MNFQFLSLIVDIFSFIAVISAILFGVIQIKQYKRQRKDTAAVELVRSFQDSEFTQAFHLLHALPENISANEFVAKGEEYIKAAWALGFRYETTGVLVFRGVIPISVVEDLIGGIGISLWKRLSPWIQLMRIEQSQDKIFEWFQWLAERMMERGNKDLAPAQILFKNWEPND